MVSAILALQERTLALEGEYFVFIKRVYEVDDDYFEYPTWPSIVENTKHNELMKDRAIEDTRQWSVGVFDKKGAK